MEHQKYNANYLKMRNEDKDYTFIPNMESNLLGRLLYKT